MFSTIELILKSKLTQIGVVKCQIRSTYFRHAQLLTNNQYTSNQYLLKY